MSELLPSPLTAADVDLRGMPFMPLDVVRLLDSDLFALSTGDEFKAAIALWCKAWNQVPAASLPSDDRILARLAGVSQREWAGLKTTALRGWVLCDDGRLHHPVVAEKAQEAWSARERQRDRARRRWANRGDAPVEPPHSAAAPPAADAAGHAAASSTAPAAAMQGTGTGTVKKKEPPAGVARAQPSPPAERGCRLPDDWAPSEIERQFAISRGMDPERVDRTAERFRNHWLAKAGKDASKRDWAATWRNWVTKDLEDRPPAAPARKREVIW